MSKEKKNHLYHFQDAEICQEFWEFFKKTCSIRTWIQPNGHFFIESVLCSEQLYFESLVSAKSFEAGWLASKNKEVEDIIMDDDLEQLDQELSVKSE